MVRVRASLKVRYPVLEICNGRAHLIRKSLDWRLETCTAGLGPDKWHQLFPVAATGRRQSPVSITTSQTLPLPLAGLGTSYSGGRDLELTNTGSGWQLRLEGGQGELSLQGETFRAEQLHAHWGGSEHQVDSLR